MSLQEFAEKYRLSVRRDGCGDLVIPGKNGHLYFDRSGLYFCLTDADRKPFKSGKLKGKVLRALDGRAKVALEGDYEAILQVVDSSPQTARLVISLCGCPRKRRLSPEQRETAVARLAGFRKTSCRTPLHGARIVRKGVEGV